MKINIRNLEFGYAKKNILNGITFNVNQGECVSILGPNGAGKSTLIKCINGLLKPQKGDVTIDNQSIYRMSRNQVSQRIGYIPQSSDGLFPLCVFDMVLLGRRPHMAWRSGKTDRKKVLAALSLLKIDHLALSNYNELSGGQQQKVIIARAIAQDTDILLLDEATSSLDIKHQLEVMDIIRKRVDNSGVLAIMIVHDLNMAARYSDRIIMMKKNRIVASGTPLEVLTDKNISLVYEVGASVQIVENKPFIVPLKTTDTQTENDVSECFN